MRPGEVRIDSWDGLIEALRGCQTFLEGAITDVAVEPGEEGGRVHAERLLGHTTDAMVLAVWIKGVAIASEKLEPE